MNRVTGTRSGKFLTSAALVWVGAAVLWAQTGTTSRPESAAAPRTSSSAPAPQSSAPVRTQPAATATSQTAVAVDQTAKYQAWIKQYCISCHNSRTASPANEPVNLETASLTNLVPHAATWERVLRKLSVRAMPPQGMPHPTEAEYVGFTSWLASSLDRAAYHRATTRQGTRTLIARPWRSVGLHMPAMPAIPG